MNEILEQLRKPFHPGVVTWKPGATNGAGDAALGMAYADLRAYQERLDEVCGMDWAVTYTPWGDRIVCHVTVGGITRSSTGEPDAQSERAEIAGTSAEAQAFKRACAMFGLGRYLYNLPAVWAEYDKQRRQFTDKGKAKLDAVVVSHYKQAELRPPGNGANGESSRSLSPGGQPPPAQPTNQDVWSAPPLDPDPLATLRLEINNIGLSLAGNKAAAWEAKRAVHVNRVTKNRTPKIEQMHEKELKELLAFLSEKAGVPVVGK
jgi:hypothetical protein